MEEPATTHPTPLSEEHWRELLALELEAPVRVRYGRARHQVVRVQRHRGTYLVSLARFFSEAPPPVRRALATWMRAGRRAKSAAATLDAWIDERVRSHEHAPRAATKLEARGEHHDLERLAREVIAGHFQAESGHAWPPAGWGRAQGSRSRRSLRLGSFDPVDRVVRLHRTLDSRDVPEWFVRYVLFHELLHSVLDRPARAKGRRVIHGPEFKARERAYPDYARALEWEREHVRGLIRAARAGKPFELPRGKAARSEKPKKTAQPAGSGQPVQGLLF